MTLWLSLSQLWSVVGTGGVPTIGSDIPSAGAAPAQRRLRLPISLRRAAGLGVCDHGR